MSETQYPNLESGYAVVYGNANHRRTEVRSILSREMTGEVAILTHECRAEAVNSTNIFDGRLYEFVAIKTWLGNYMMRSGANQYGFGESLPNSAYQLSDGSKIDVDCPLANVHELSFDEALKNLRKPTSGRYFIKIDYVYEGENWIVYAPARHINFPDADETRRYLQPISGYTLFFNGERFLITYVAAHIEEGACHIEFIAREPIHFLETKPKTGRLRKWLSPFQPITKKLLRTDEFWKVYVVEGRATIYRYV